MKEITDYPKYKITDDGDVYSFAKDKVKGRQLKPQKASQSKKGYFQVRLFNKEYPNGRLQYTHRLVWETYKGKIPHDKEVDHIDNDTNNNHISNLQLVSRRGNMVKYNREKFGELVYDIIDDIRKYQKEGLTTQQIADKTGKSYTTIWRVVKGKRGVIKNRKFRYIDYDYGL